MKGEYAQCPRCGFFDFLADHACFPEWEVSWAGSDEHQTIRAKTAEAAIQEFCLVQLGVGFVTADPFEVSVRNAFTGVGSTYRVTTKVSYEIAESR